MESGRESLSFSSQPKVMNDGRNIYKLIEMSLSFPFHAETNGNVTSSIRNIPPTELLTY